MKDETSEWIRYAEENLKAAKLLADGILYNPCLQNVQQAAEKAIKSIIVEKSIQFIKTHSISDLKNYLQSHNLMIDLSDEECEFLDTIYLPSKYALYLIILLRVKYVIRSFQLLKDCQVLLKFC